MSHSLIIQKPVVANRLILLFHGVGANPNSLAPLGRWLADALDRAMIVAVAAPDRFDFGEGFQWFSIKEVTEDNRLERIKTAMPAFIKTVHEWQATANVGAEDTAIVGFSQGAIMALSSTQLENTQLAREVVSLSGRFAVQPTQKPAGTSVHFLHGTKDPVIPVIHAEQGFNWLEALGASTTLETFDGLAHSISQAEAEHLLALLKG
ncbi:esterase [Rhodanobacter aciditrophus]|uniref:Esterase n=1 Tax=Rhodanobacter aciditrophus TaxID=1623218 RepID=A0ABW4B1D4_9GAMM